MAVNIAPKSLDTELSELMREVSSGKEQLPEFQRGWTWDNDRIRGIIASLSQGYPMGAIMRLEYGNENVRFKYRTIEGVTVTGVTPEFLILDGQQRLTSMYRATCCKEPVETTTEKGKEIKRYYYLDIKKCLDESEDQVDAVVAVPDDRRIKPLFNRELDLDLSTRELEYEHEMFPINIIFDSNAREDWADGYKEYHEYDKAFMEKYKQFRTQVIDTIVGYKLPVITLGKETPREAVCKVFENVNTGGVPLTVFELVTATFATYDFDLRKDWIECRDKIRGKGETLNTDVMEGVDETSFLTAITLYTTYLSDKMTTCKKKDVLALNFEDYKKNSGILLEGYKMARKFLFQQYVFRKRDLPYTAQLIPLSAICAVIGTATFNLPSTQKILAKCFWCGIMGEMYGSASETRYATDIEDAIGLSIATEEYGSKFFANGAAPGGVLEHPGTLKNPARVRESWNQAFGGSANANKVAVLEEGMYFTPISIAPDQAQFLETRKFQLNEIARIFRVPPHMIGDLERATFSNIEHLSLEFVKYSLDPWLVRWEQSMSRVLFTDDEKREYFIKFNVDGLLRGDYQSRMSGYSVGIRNGFLSPNDARELENMDLIPDELGGNRYLCNGNMIDIGSAARSYVE